MAISIVAASRLVERHREDFTRDICVTDVIRDPLPKPGLKGRQQRPRLRVGVGLRYQHPSPFVGEMGDVSRALQQLIDQLLTFGRRIIVQKLTNQRHRRNLASDIEMDAPQEFRVADRRGRNNLLLVQGSVNQFVDA